MNRHISKHMKHREEIESLWKSWTSVGKNHVHSNRDGVKSTDPNWSWPRYSSSHQVEWHINWRRKKDTHTHTHTHTHVFEVWKAPVVDHKVYGTFFCPSKFPSFKETSLHSFTIIVTFCYILKVTDGICWKWLMLVYVCCVQLL